MWLLAATLLFIVRQSVGRSEPIMNLRSQREQNIIKASLHNYTRAVRPQGGRAVVVNVSVWVLSLSGFDDVRMEFTAQFNFQQEWLDERLAFNDSRVGADRFISFAYDQRVWIPDTFFQNEQHGHEHLIDQPNQLLRVNSRGLIRYRKRLTMAFSCPMILAFFPHDYQSCVIEFSSYGYTTKDIVYQWNGDGAVTFITSNLPKFAMRSHRQESCASNTTTGQYSCLRIKLLLRREFAYFFLQLYIPSSMLVAVSCVSFCIDWRCAPARVPLTIVTLLTITTQSHSINAMLPPVSYTKAIDIWIGACVILIFGALIEYAVVNYVGKNEENARARYRNLKFKASSMNEASFTCRPEDLYLAAMAKDDVDKAIRLQRAIAFESGVGGREDHSLTPELGDCFDAREYASYRLKLRQYFQRKMRRFEGSAEAKTTAERIDTFAVALFPLAFVAFNVFYWYTYLYSVHMDNETD